MKAQNKIVQSTLLVSWLPYLLLAIWLFTTHPTVWLDEAALSYAADWYSLPYGPMSLLFPLDASFIRNLATVLPSLHIFGLILFCIPYRKFRITGGLLGGAAVILIDGINYSSGKVDHQLISHSLPFLIALGEIVGSELIFVLSALGFFYFQSVTGKALNSWFDLRYFAMRDWLVLYRDFYGATTPIGAWLLENGPTYSSLWKIADFLVVGTEAAILFLWFMVRMNRYHAMLILLVFHFSISLVFGIDFTKLLLPVYWWAMRDQTTERGKARMKRDGYWLAWGTAALFAITWISPELRFVLLSALCLIGAYTDRTHFKGLLGTIDWTRWKKPWPIQTFVFWSGLNCIAIAMSVGGYEPFPSYGGPIFPGGAKPSECSGACRIVLVPAEGSVAKRPANAKNIQISLNQLGLDPRSGGSTENLGAQLKHFGLDPRPWIPKLVQYVVANGLAEQDGVHCLNHDFLPSRADAQRLTSAVKKTAQERGFKIEVKWSTYGNCRKGDSK